jgi:hypothetical protein
MTDEWIWSTGGEILTGENWKTSDESLSHCHFTYNIFHRTSPG